MPVTVPVLPVPVMVATSGLPLVHKPPLTPSLKVALAPVQRLPRPMMAVGVPYTVKGRVL